MQMNYSPFQFISFWILTSQVQVTVDSECPDCTNAISVIFHSQSSPSIPVDTRMTLGLSSFLHTFQVNDTWLLSKIKCTIEKAGVKLLLCYNTWQCFCVLATFVKGFGFKTCEKAKQDGNIESVSVVEEANWTNKSQLVLLKYTHESINSMCGKDETFERSVCFLRTSMLMFSHVFWGDTVPTIR